MTPEIAKSAANTTFRWLWALAVVTCVFIASGRSQVAAPNIIDFDKAAHFSVFGLIASLVARSLPPGRRWWAVLIVSVYGASDEFRQSFTPGRDVEVGDWLADSLGALVAVTAYLCWPAYRRLMEHRLFGRRRARPALESVNANAETRPF